MRSQKGGVTLGTEMLGSRIKDVRKALDLSQDEFGRRLGVTRGAITNLEFNKTEPKPLFIDLLCRQFNINEDWLRTGQGNMFIKLSRDEEIASFKGDVMKGEPDFRRRLIGVLSRLNVEEWELLEKVALDFVEEMKNADS